MSKALSDENLKSRNSRVSRSDVYADLDLNFRRHPNTADVRPLKDLDAVKNSVKNLLLTNYGDRPFQPGVGSNITSLLFEPADAFTANALRDEIKTCLERYEPRLSNVTVQTLIDDDRNAYEVTVGFTVRYDERSQQEISFYLERLR